jgi:hypothetical protein
MGLRRLISMCTILRTPSASDVSEPEAENLAGRRWMDRHEISLPVGEPGSRICIRGTETVLLAPSLTVPVGLPHTGFISK